MLGPWSLVAGRTRRRSELRAPRRSPARNFIAAIAQLVHDALLQRKGRIKAVRPSAHQPYGEGKRSPTISYFSSFKKFPEADRSIEDQLPRASSLAVLR